MRSATLQKIVIIAATLMTFVLAAQLYWLKATYSLEEKEFNVKVHTALRTVVEQIRVSRQDTAPFIEVVEQPLRNYFLANIKYPVDSDQVEFLLKSAFEAYNVFTTFKFGVYDARTDKMKYIRYIRSAPAPFEKEDPNVVLPVFKKKFNYIGVFFPNRERFIINELNFWIFSTAALMIVILGFAISIFKLVRQKQLSEIQKDFINNMTHEFRTPISTIQLSTEVIKNFPAVQSNQRIFNYANIIENEVNHLEEQVERVLQVARLERHTSDLQKEQVNVHDIIRQSAQDFESVIQVKEGEFRLILNATHYMILADKLHFTNIIFNLVDNAIKYSVKPLVTIITADYKNGVSVSIQDNGIGIPRQYQKFLFTKFFRVPTGNLHEVKGFGLGLNYVKLYTKAFNGTVQLESEPGKGSIFTLYFPD